MKSRLIMLLSSLIVLAACDQQSTEEKQPQIQREAERQSAAVAPVAVSNLALDEIVGFSDVEHCAPSTVFEELLDGLLPTGQLGEMIEPHKPVFPSKFASAFGKSVVVKEDDTNTATVEISGTWQDLPLSSLGVWKTPESDYQGFSITFDAPFQRVLDTLNNIGFKLPSSGKREAGEVLASYVYLETNLGKTTLTCSTG
jgi:hypothetical protein